MQHLRKKTKISSLIVALLFLWYAPLAQGHGLGTNKQATSGNYTVEFEYEALEAVPAQEPIFYNVRLLGKKSGVEEVFDVAYVRISNSNGSALSANFAPAPDTTGLSRFTFSLPAAGNYEAQVSFLRNGNTVAEARFPYSAITSSDKNGQSSTLLSGRYWALLAVCLGIGLSIGLLIKSRNPQP